MADVAQASPSGLMPIGEVAARNIALALNLPEEHIKTIERSIKDEISAMSSHFTLTFADVQTSYEVDVKKLKADYTAEVEEIRSAFKFVSANLGAVFAVSVAVYVVGVITGYLL